MKKLFIIIYLLTNIFILGACDDVEAAGDPQPRVPRVEVESDNYYVQITNENKDGNAFVYRWLNMETAAKYVITLSTEGSEETITVPDKSILTYNGVRELQFTNKDIMGYLDTFYLLAPGRETTFTITLEAFTADGTSITSEAAKASKTSTVHVIIAPDVNLTTN